jgi:hypothetical protein
VENYVSKDSLRRDFLTADLKNFEVKFSEKNIIVKKRAQGKDFQKQKSNTLNLLNMATKEHQYHLKSKLSSNKKKKKKRYQDFNKSFTRSHFSISYSHNDTILHDREVLKDKNIKMYRMKPLEGELTPDCSMNFDIDDDENSLVEEKALNAKENSKGGPMQVNNTEVDFNLSPIEKRTAKKLPNLKLEKNEAEHSSEKIINKNNYIYSSSKSNDLSIKKHTSTLSKIKGSGTSPKTSNNLKSSQFNKY